MSETTQQQKLQHLPPYRTNTWDRIGVASTVNGVDMVGLLRHYEKKGFFPDDTHPSLGYHTSTSSLNDPVRIATISLAGFKHLHIALGHSYLIAPYGNGDATVALIEEARQVLHRFNLNGGLEYTFKLPTGKGSDELRRVLVAQEIDKLLDLAAIDLIHQPIKTPRRVGKNSGLDARL